LAEKVIGVWRTAYIRCTNWDDAVPVLGLVQSSAPSTATLDTVPEKLNDVVADRVTTIELEYDMVDILSDGKPRLRKNCGPRLTPESTSKSSMPEYPEYDGALVANATHPNMFVFTPANQLVCV